MAATSRMVGGRREPHVWTIVLVGLVVRVMVFNGSGRWNGADDGWNENIRLADATNRYTQGTNKATKNEHYGPNKEMWKFTTIDSLRPSALGRNDIVVIAVGTLHPTVQTPTSRRSRDPPKSWSRQPLRNHCSAPSGPLLFLFHLLTSCSHSCCVCLLHQLIQLWTHPCQSQDWKERKCHGHHCDLSVEASAYCCQCIPYRSSHLGHPKSVSIFFNHHVPFTSPQQCSTMTATTASPLLAVQPSSPLYLFSHL